MKWFAKYLTITFIISSIGMVKSQEIKRGGIDQELLKELKNSFNKDGKTKAIINAATNIDPKNLMLNRENIGKTDHFFSNQVKVKGITNQKSSGRCWLFTSLNVFRPKVIEKLGLEDFEFSQNYLFFYDLLEKANLFLEGVIATKNKDMDDKTVEWLFKNPIGDGGQWSMFADIGEKYGLVPKSVMAETFNSDNTSVMNSVLSRKLREDGLEIRDMYTPKVKEEKFYKRKVEMLSEIYRILVISLGEPPEEFTWRYKTKDGKLSEPKKFTPKSFYKEVVGVNLKDYIMLMNDPTREYYKIYEVEFDRDMYDGQNWKYINLPMDDIKQIAKSSILGNDAMYFSCDVGKQLNTNDGYLDLNNYDYESLYGVKFGMNKTKRIKTFDSGSSHGMTLVGVDLDKDGSILKWQVENSWGADKGNKGYLTMTDKWFDEYMFRLVVFKKYIPEKILDILKQKPILLPPWDPMFMSEE
ncbi:MAG: C1 family peptidase [Bacteroidota bacterium]|nr:C1 family peptidase [Bacteroidota bacterium]